MDRLTFALYAVSAAFALIAVLTWRLGAIVKRFDRHYHYTHVPGADADIMSPTSPPVQPNQETPR